MKDRHAAFPYILLAVVLATLILFEWMNLVQEDRTEKAWGAAQDIPKLNQVYPTSAFNDHNTWITISGSNFEVMTTTAGVILPSVQLGSTILKDIERVDSATLKASVPEGMPAGIYTLTVINPSGQSGNLNHAFTVQPVEEKRSSQKP
jgi:hypothetical protein